MIWSSNICRICAKISEICIPIFQEGSTNLEGKIRRCLNTILTKEDLKPKQVCHDCCVKLTDFYNFIALFHESNYRFEILLYQPSQNPSLLSTTQDCVNREINVSVSGNGSNGSNNNLPSHKSEDLGDCNSLGLIIEYKDMLPLTNLDVHAHDFGEHNIINEIVEQVSVNNHAEIVPNFGNQICADNVQISTAIKNFKHEHFSGKLRNLNNYLEAHEETIHFSKCNGNPSCIKNNTSAINSVTQTVYSVNNSGDVKEKGLKRLSCKLETEALHKLSDNDKFQKSRIKLKKLNNDVDHNKNNNSLFEKENILNEIASQTNEVDIDNIEVQNFGSTNDESICTDLIIRNSHLDKIDKIQEVYLELEQGINGNSMYTNNGNLNRDCGDHLQLDCQFTQNRESTNDELKSNNIMKKRNGKINIIAVSTICKMMENRPQLQIIPKKSRLNRFKQSPKSDVISSKTKLINNNNNNQNKIEKPLNNPKRFTCIYCKKVFGRRQHMNEHVKKHENSRPYVCDVCNKTFAVQWDLTFHKRIHTSLYSCDHCGKCFSAPSKLQRHVRIHTGEKPFVCSFKDCSRSFSDKRNLDGHQITHTNIRKFTCDICKRSYKTKSQLKDHMQAHNEIPAFKCTNCDKSYKWKTNLLIHMRKHNQNDVN